MTTSIIDCKLFSVLAVGFLLYSGCAPPLNKVTPEKLELGELEGVTVGEWRSAGAGRSEIEAAVMREIAKGYEYQFKRGVLDHKKLHASFQTELNRQMQDSRDDDRLEPFAISAFYAAAY